MHEPQRFSHVQFFCERRAVSSVFHYMARQLFVFSILGILHSSTELDRYPRIVSMSLSAAESLELQRLLAKAKSRPMPCTPVEDSDFSVYDPATGLLDWLLSP